ncbi:DMT family transporter [Streptomyces sp. NPDC088554]|uniref:DMT family transporter n=1 Tax=Streptomyces sp. NPDC088554 TaxID=3365865 RepID=UPI00382956C0
MVRGYLLIGVSATGFGLMPVIATCAYRDGLTLTTLLFLRFALAAAVFLPFAVRHARRTGRPSPANLLRLIVLGGVLYMAQSALYFSSVKHISPALAALLLYVYPALVAIVSSVIGRERPSWAILGSILASFAGVALVLGRIGADLSLVGVLQVLGSAGVYTAYILYGDRVSGSVHPVVTTACVSASASVSFLLYGVATGGLRFDFAPRGWLWVLALALVSTVVAILCFFLGMTLIGPTRAAIGSMLEPVVSIVATAVLLSGGLTWTQLLAAALVLTGATTGVLSRRPPSPDPRPVPAPPPSREQGAAPPPSRYEPPPRR